MNMMVQKDGFMGRHRSEPVVVLSTATDCQSVPAPILPSSSQCLPP